MRALFFLLSAPFLMFFVLGCLFNLGLIHDGHCSGIGCNKKGRVAICFEQATRPFSISS